MFFSNAYFKKTQMVSRLIISESFSYMRPVGAIGAQEISFLAYPKVSHLFF